MDGINNNKESQECDNSRRDSAPQEQLKFFFFHFNFQNLHFVVEESIIYLRFNSLEATKFFFFSFFSFSRNSFVSFPVLSSLFIFLYFQGETQITPNLMGEKNRNISAALKPNFGSSLSCPHFNFQKPGMKSRESNPIFQFSLFSRVPKLPVLFISQSFVGLAEGKTEIFIL